MMNEHKKGVKAPKYTKKSKGVEPIKPRNFVAKNQQTSGAGAHKDKKKAAKQGAVKHKKMSSYLEDLDAKLKEQVKTLREAGLDPLKRIQIIQYLAKEMDWEINYLELASDEELVDMYQQVKQKKGTVRKEGVAETALRDKADLQAKRKALQDLQMDPQVAKEPVLTKAVQQRKLELEKEAQTKGLAETHKGWTHDTLAARLFDHTDDEYTDRLQNMLEGKVAFLQATKKPK